MECATVINMVRTTFFDPGTDVVVEGTVGPRWGVAELITAVLARRSGRGHPAALLTRDDGAALVLGTDGGLAVLGWVDRAGTSYSSVGGGPRSFGYDYFGSWTEAPPHAQVTLEAAAAAAQQFAETGSPVTEHVTFEPD